MSPLLQKSFFNNFFRIFCLLSVLRLFHRFTNQPHHRLNVESSAWRVTGTDDHQFFGRDHEYILTIVTVTTEHVFRNIGVFTGAVQPEEGPVLSARNLSPGLWYLNPPFRQDLFPQPFAVVKVKQTEPGIITLSGIQVGRSSIEASGSQITLRIPVLLKRALRRKTRYSSSLANRVRGCVTHNVGGYRGFSHMESGGATCFLLRRNHLFQPCEASLSHRKGFRNLTFHSSPLFMCNKWFTVIPFSCVASPLGLKPGEWMSSFPSMTENSCNRVGETLRHRPAEKTTGRGEITPKPLSDDLAPVHHRYPQCSFQPEVSAKAWSSASSSFSKSIPPGIVSKEGRLPQEIVWDFLPEDQTPDNPKLPLPPPERHQHSPDLH